MFQLQLLTAATVIVIVMSFYYHCLCEQESLLEAHMNDCGAVDFVRGKSASLPKQIKAFVAIMHAEADRKSNALFQVRTTCYVCICLTYTTAVHIWCHMQCR